MRRLELSIDENNVAADIRDAVIGAEPDECHGCVYALNHSYETGQYARTHGLSPKEAAELAWGYAGACCKTVVDLTLLPPSPVLSAAERKEFVPVFV